MLVFGVSMRWLIYITLSVTSVLGLIVVILGADLFIYGSWELFPNEEQQNKTLLGALFIIGAGFLFASISVYGIWFFRKYNRL